MVSLKILTSKKVNSVSEFEHVIREFVQFFAIVATSEIPVINETADR